MSLADELRHLIEGARKTDDDIAYYSGGPTHNPSKERLTELVMTKGDTILAALTERKAPGEVEGLVERPSDQDVETMLSRKWLDPECLHDGCQSLVWKRKFERCDAERDKFLWQVRDTCSRAEKAEAELASLKQQLAEREEALRVYADTLCEFGLGNTGCGKYADDVCFGCRARALTRNTDGAATCNQGSAPENGEG
jgi:hypothetical protein